MGERIDIVAVEAKHDWVIPCADPRRVACFHAVRNNIVYTYFTIRVYLSIDYFAVCVFYCFTVYFKYYFTCGDCFVTSCYFSFKCYCASCLYVTCYWCYCEFCFRCCDGCCDCCCFFVVFSCSSVYCCDVNVLSAKVFRYCVLGGCYTVNYFGIDYFTVSVFYCFTVYFECYFCLCNVCINVIFIVYACTYYGRPTNFEFNKVYFKYVFLGAVELWYCFLGGVADCVGVCISFNHLNTIIIYYYLCIVTVNGKFHVKKNGGCDI